MEKIKAARGTHDILADDAKLWQFIELTAQEHFNQAAFDEIRTPIFEQTKLFSRAVGESSDIVNKEMYTFNDRSDSSMTLRPEGTAGVVRAYIENALDRSAKPQRLWYRGPMFRYERPQTGRFRQFHQIGIEAFGLEGPYIDLEVIQLAYSFLKKLGLNDLKLYINSLGNEASRQAYRETLLKFLEAHKDEVCEDCQRRMEQNPLRVLDCKVPEDQELYKQAPLLKDSLDEESLQVWNEVKEALTAMDIDYVEDPSLVRGLDYYSHCVFEFKTEDKGLGQQSTVLAGGRYDKLAEQLGANPTPAVGWALGIERLAYLLKQRLAEEETSSEKNHIYIISDSALEALKLSQKLRSDLGKDFVVEFDFDSVKVGKQINKSLKRSADYALFYLEDERSHGTFKIKDFALELEEELSSYSELLEKFQLAGNISKGTVDV